MTIELTHPERELLLEILNSRLGSLKEQIYHSTTSTFTEGLRERKALLLGVIEKVEGAVSASAGGPDHS